MILSAWQAVCKACGNVGGVDVTGGASKARMPEMNAQRLCTDAKPYKHAYTLPYKYSYR